MWFAKVKVVFIVNSAICRGHTKDINCINLTSTVVEGCDRIDWRMCMWLKELIICCVHLLRWTIEWDKFSTMTKTLDSSGLVTFSQYEYNPPTNVQQLFCATNHLLTYPRQFVLWKLKQLGVFVFGKQTNCHWYNAIISLFLSFHFNLYSSCVCYDCSFCEKVPQFYTFKLSGISAFMYTSCFLVVFLSSYNEVVATTSSLICRQPVSHVHVRVILTMDFSHY